MKQVKEEENKEKDAKKKAKLTEKVRTMETTIAGLHDGDYRLTRVLDAAARVFLRPGDPTPADSVTTVVERSDRLSAVLSKLQYAKHAAPLLCGDHVDRPKHERGVPRLQEDEGHA